jgi:putative glutamine amidotransferase
MTYRPLILVSPNVESKGDEFGDLSTSLSETYQIALFAAGAIPVGLPATVERDAIARCVERCDGVLLTGGEDVDPKLHFPNAPEALLKTVTLTPDGGARDLRELLLVDEVFRQNKPLLAICRGHQVLNVALGGNLILDIPSECPQAIDHRRHDRKSDIVHEVRLTPDSLLAKITSGKKLGVNSTHHQAVGAVAEALTVVAQSRDGVVEGMELKKSSDKRLPFLLSVQFHPERLADRYAEHRAIFSAFSAACALHGRQNL